MRSANRIINLAMESVAMMEFPTNSVFLQVMGKHTNLKKLVLACWKKNLFQIQVKLMQKHKQPTACTTPG